MAKWARHRDGSSRPPFAAFFEAPCVGAHFGETEAKRNDGCRYLLHELPKNPAVTVE